MKKLSLILGILFFVATVFAQTDDDKNDEMKTIFGGVTDFSVGGFGGPIPSFSMFGDNLGFLMGGNGGVIINHSIIFGGGGYGLTSDLPVSNNKYEILNLNSSDNYNFQFGYGGLILNWHFLLLTMKNKFVCY